MSARLNDLMELLVHSDDYMGILREITDGAAIERTRAAATILKLNPAILQDNESLQGMCNDLGALQLVVTDEKGTITASLDEKLVGKDLSLFDDNDRLIDCITQPGYEVCIRVDESSTESAVQYVGVHREDAPGALVMGYRGPREQAVHSALSFANLAQSYDLGKRGYIVAFKEGALLGDETPPFPTADLISLPIGKARRLSLGDTEYFTYAILRQGYRLVGMMPVRELRISSLHALRPLLISNAVLVLAISVLLMYLLHRLVLRNISTICSVLRRIAQGDTQTRLESTNLPTEFRKLSAGINSAIDALQTISRKNDEAVMRELEEAAALENALIPHVFPAFPLRSEFALHAACRRAAAVGGGMYDYFMVGENSLFLMMADATGSPLRAALISMHVTGVIRQYAQSGMTPADICTHVNSILCEADWSDVGLSLFCGVLDVSSGKLTCTNAGHIHALLQHGNDPYSVMEIPPSMETGRMKAAAYADTTCSLEPGDRMFLCSEGLLMAPDSQLAPFGDERLMEALSAPASTVAEVIRHVSQALRRHIQDATQNRDSVMLALEIEGKKHGRAGMTLSAGEAADHFLEQHLESVFASPVAIAELQRAVQSISTALPAGTGISLMLDFDEEAATVTLNYPPPVFNPLEHLARLQVDRADHSSASDGANAITLYKLLS